jgi:GNAT superfamily N-acetyltransferase
LASLSEDQRSRFINALQTIERTALGIKSESPPIVLRSHRPGDMGMVVHLEGHGYVEQFGWDQSFEALAARIVADFLANFDELRERCWIAEMDGRHVGHVFLVRHPDQPDAAKLRLLYVDSAARGMGLGRRLVTECVGFAVQAGYRKVTLWTQSVLTAAHRIYQAAGFRLVREEPHHSFGKDLIGQTWELELP